MSALELSKLRYSDFTKSAGFTAAKLNMPVFRGCAARTGRSLTRDNPSLKTGHSKRHLHVARASQPQAGSLAASERHRLKQEIISIVERMGPAAILPGSEQVGWELC